MAEIVETGAPEPEPDPEPEQDAAQPAPIFVGKPSMAPTMYADSCVFLTGVGNNIRLQFVEAIPGASDSTDPGLKLRYALNLIMPYEGFKAMVNYARQTAPDLFAEPEDGE